MFHELKTISLVTAFIFPFFWAITYLISGLRKEKSKRYVFVVMLFASFAYMMTYFKFEGHIYLYSKLFPVQTGVVFTLFPLIYLYIKSLTSEKIIPRIYIALHFVPSVIVFVSVFYIQKVVIGIGLEEDFVSFLLDKKVLVRNHFTIGKSIYGIYKKIFVLISMGYIVALIREIRKHYMKVKELFSDNDKTELRWFRGLGIIFCLMVVFFVIIHILPNYMVEAHTWIIACSYSTFGLFFWYLGLHGFRQKEVYNIEQIEESDEFEESVRISRTEIESYLLASKIYKKKDVSLFDLCYHFHTNRTYLSESIKQNFDLNFRGLINKYRIEEAKKSMEELIDGKNNCDLECIAYNSGFSSYSTFFRVFKSEVGITPSEYIKVNLKETKKS